MINLILYEMNDSLIPTDPAGNIRTTTLKGFSKDEFVGIIKKLP